MSRIGKMPIKIPNQVDFSVEGRRAIVSGPKGTLEFSLSEKIEATCQDNEVLLISKDDSRRGKAIYGLSRALVANMVRGVTDGFRKELELAGVGYRAQVEEGNLKLALGFSHPVKFQAPPGISFTVAENKIIIEGADKQLVGEVASRIRRLKPPEPYKGKGIKYAGEKIRRKAGKAAKVIGGGK
ncbi:MAG: 50S ribosomal protein L6 [bacterium]|nr:50S ribosomal protein L6 [bacterium]